MSKSVTGIESILIGTQSAKKLANFYKEKVGLKVTFEGVMGEKEQIYGFEMKGGSSLYIVDHSRVKGKSKEPQRIILNFEVDDIKKDVAKLKRGKVKLIKDTYRVEDYGYIATFEDVDGNYFQLVQTRG